MRKVVVFIYSTVHCLHSPRLILYFRLHIDSCLYCVCVLRFCLPHRFMLLSTCPVPDCRQRQTCYQPINIRLPWRYLRRRQWLLLLLLVVFPFHSRFNQFFCFLSLHRSSLKALNKKEHKNGGCSPDSPGEDVDATDYTLTPRTEAKYNKIDEEFQMMMQRTQHLNGAQRVRNTNFTNAHSPIFFCLYIFLFTHPGWRLHDARFGTCESRSVPR
jgi:hypothetical protein